MRPMPILKVLREVVVPLVVAIVLAVPAFACPVCATDTGQQVRQGIFDDRFWVNVLLILLPFPVFIGVAAGLYRGFPAGREPASPPHGGQ